MTGFCFHYWSKWSEPFSSTHTYRKLQARTCTLCGKVYVKEIKQPSGAYFNLEHLKKSLGII